MRRIFFVAIFAVICSVTVAQNNSSKDLYLTKSFNDAGFKKIDVETSHGDISVSVVPAAETRVEVYVHSNNFYDILTKEQIQKKLDEYYTLNVSLSGDALRAVAHRKKDFPDGMSSLRISFMIYATKDKSNALTTDHGNIDLSGMKGDQQLHTDHGDISASYITGKLYAVTDHGNVSVKESNDDIDIRTDHGDLVLDNVKGKMHAVTDHGNVTGQMINGVLYATTSHGDIDLRNLSCSVETSTDHGNVSVSVDKISGDIKADNSHGDISMHLPTGNGLDLDLHGKGVSMNSKEVFNGTMNKDEVEGTLNGGGAKISARTDKGDVNLSVR